MADIDYISSLTGEQMDTALTEMSQRNSEAWAVGTRGGLPVSSSDITYENNAKHYAEQAEATLENKVDKVPGKGLSTNDYTDTEKAKLSGIAEGAEVNVVETIKTSDGEALPVVGKVVTLPEFAMASALNALGLSVVDGMLCMTFNEV